MTKEEIKKALYKENPTANLSFIRKGIIYYDTLIGSVTKEDITPVYFQVPISDIGDADFFPTMDAKYLIRYLHLTP